MYNQFPYSSFGNPYNSFAMPNNTTGILGLSKKFNWDGFLNNAQRTLNVINQAMPIYNQVKPMFRNMGTVFRIMGELNNTSTQSTVVNTASNTPQFFA